MKIKGPSIHNEDVRVRAAEAVELSGSQAALLLNNLNHNMTYDETCAIGDRIQKIVDRIKERDPKTR